MIRTFIKGSENYNEYVLVRGEGLQPLRHIQKTTVNVMEKQNQIILENTGNQIVFFVSLATNQKALVFEDDFLILLPGESRIVPVKKLQQYYTLKMDGLNL